jgi:hypothetical protein
LKVYITPEAKQKLDLYVDAVEDEISGLGKVRKIGNRVMIEEVYLLKQESSTSSTDLNMAAVSDFLVEMVNKNEGAEHLKLWWHSHGNMSAFWSGTDEKTVEEFDNEWMISLVVNRKSEYKCRLDVYDPVHLVVDNAELCVSMAEPTAALKAAVKKEVEDKVNVKKFYQGSGYMGGFDNDYGLGRDGYVDERDRRYGPVPFSGGRIGVWKKDKDGVWRLSREDDDKEEVSRLQKESQKDKGEGAKENGKGKIWQTIGFRQSEK